MIVFTMNPVSTADFAGIFPDGRESAGVFNL
jgi:hypothetical protein